MIPPALQGEAASVQANITMGDYVRSTVSVVVADAYFFHFFPNFRGTTNITTT